ncbi:hypothetical protein Nepgr_006824 [Nepenthes gracilis]|uniref:BZIP domain-containing protein n=1 Tax=Nepenthes gracilis TaxID=150966 RepID=A0AAD3S5T3_NEPGR|nr:hypothetical protein Nepgr_006824 [Nepenthes gracilis]
MGELEFLKNDETNPWKHLFDNLSEGFDLIEADADIDAPSSLVEKAVVQGKSSFDASQETVPSWIGELESFLMNDDDETDDCKVIDDCRICPAFLSDVLLDPSAPTDFHPSGPVRINGSSDDKILTLLSDSRENSSNSDSNVNKGMRDALEPQSIENDDDPISKKRRRQLRNRDAALRSRERRKMYVRDLEMKCRYLETECRRLGRLLQCCYAENHMLRLSLPGSGAFGAPLAKQESAVLLLESLLLGSLLWLLGITCLIPLPGLHQLTQDAVLLGSVDSQGQESVVPRGTRSKLAELWVLLSFLTSKRCRASRIKMRSCFPAAGMSSSTVA